MEKYNTTLELTKAQKEVLNVFFDKHSDLYYDLSLLKEKPTYLYGSLEIDYINKKLINIPRVTPCHSSNTLYGMHFRLPDDKYINIVAMVSDSFYVNNKILVAQVYLYINDKNELCNYNTVVDLLDVKNKYFFGSQLNDYFCRKQCFFGESAETAFLKENPYSGLYEFNETIHNELSYDQKNFYLALYLKYPFIELLIKAGYHNLIIGWLYELMAGHKDDRYKILLKPGKDIKSIFQIPKFIYEDLKEEKDINIWHNVRLLNKKYEFTNESYQKFRDFNIPFGPTSILQRILKLKFDEKPLYTLNSLMTYLSRVDMYQAIEPAEAAQILLDYLNMNIEMNVMPDLNSNSLKREHDVTVRNYNLVAKEIEEQKFKSVAKKLEKYEYTGNKYCIIAPKSGQDLINEGRNNRNCVGSYIKNVTSGRDIILFMREKSKKDKSMVTIELSPNGEEIWQKYETANRTITDEEKLTFIDEWMSYIKKNTKKEA